MKYSILFVFSLGLVSLLSCTIDKFETDPCLSVSYSETVHRVVEKKCATAGCHVPGFQPGDFTSYDVLKKKAEEGKIQLTVFKLGNMPPVEKLTVDEKAVLKCWIESGAHSD
jgi:hypothetical protein